MESASSGDEYILDLPDPPEPTTREKAERYISRCTPWGAAEKWKCRVIAALGAMFLEDASPDQLESFVARAEEFEQYRPEPVYRID